MKNNLVLRAMQEADFPNIMVIQQACYYALEPESWASLHAKFSLSPRTCLVAETDSRLIGYLFALPWHDQSLPALNCILTELPAAPNCLYVHDLAIHPDVRHSGAGSAMIRSVRQIALQHQLSKAILVSVQGSQPFWARHGFSPRTLTSALRHKLQTYGADVLAMECDLPATPGA